MKTRWLATTLLLLLPAAAVAQQLEYGMRSGVAWTDNVFGTSDESSQPRQDDWSLRLSPWGRLSDPDGDLTWSLRYQPSYEYYIDESDLRGFDHNANGELSWRVGDRTTLFATEEYAQYQSLVRFNENTGSPTDPAVLRGKNESISSNVLSAGVRHFLTPRDVFLLSGSYTFRAYSTGGSTDNWTTTLGTSYEHNLSERTTIGATGLLDPADLPARPGPRHRDRLLQHLGCAPAQLLANVERRALRRPDADRRQPGRGQLLAAVRSRCRSAAAGRPSTPTTVRS